MIASVFEIISWPRRPAERPKRPIGNGDARLVFRLWGLLQLEQYEIVEKRDQVALLLFRETDESGL